MTAAPASSPLAGVRVLDLTSVMFGPLATLVLADMGADVVKVESPEGDVVRHVGPARTPGMGPLFLNLNRNKRSVVIDLKQTRGVETFMRLAATADVFVHSMRRQAIDRLGLAYDAVSSENERILYCNLVGFGFRGRYRDLLAYDDVIQGGSGIAALQASLAGRPQYVAGAIADKTAGLAAAAVILAGLYERERSGQGQELEVPMFETLVSHVLTEHLYGSTFEPPLGPTAYGRTTSPERQPYETMDGYLSVIIYTDRQWASFWKLAGLPERRDDERFASITTRTEHIDELYGTVARVLRSRHTAEWLELLAAADIPAFPVLSPDDLLQDEHVRDVGLIEMQQHPSEGVLRVLRPSFWFSRTVTAAAQPAPTLGLHTHDVLVEAGFDTAEVEQLRTEGVVGPSG